MSEQMDIDGENENNNNNGNSELYPIAVLIDELKSDDDAARLRSVQALVRIGNALGPDRTRNELIPFVTESCDDSDDILGSNRVCIAVIDESSSAGTVDSANTASNAVTVSEYNAFRATFPNRRHYILQPTPTGVAKTEAIMTDAVKAVYVSGFTDGRQVQGVNRDGGDASEASDWFNIIGISTMNITKLALFIDTSGSMNLTTIAASRAKFIGTCTDNGITIREEDNGDEDWIEPFTGILA